MAAKVAELRAEGDRHFLSKAFGKALESYEQAIKQLGDAPGKAALLLPSAGCYLQEKRWAMQIGPGQPCLTSTPSTSPGSDMHWKQQLTAESGRSSAVHWPPRGRSWACADRWCATVSRCQAQLIYG